MPVKIEDLLGARTDMQVMSARMGKLEGQSCLILTVKLVGSDDASELRYGILPDMIDKVLAAGSKTPNGVVLKLPAPNKAAKITWITMY